MFLSELTCCHMVCVCGKKRGWGGLTPPNTSTNKIIFTSLQCHSNNSIPEQNMVGIESRSCTYCSCTDVLFPPLHTHTHSGEEYYSLWQVYQPPLVSHRALLLRAWCSVPCVTYLPLEEPGQLSVRKGGGGGGVCVCVCLFELCNGRGERVLVSALLCLLWFNHGVLSYHHSSCLTLCTLPSSPLPPLPALQAHALAG